MKKLKQLLVSFVIMLGSGIEASADEYAVIMTDSKIYEEPNARGYVARNMNDEEVTVSKGMVFKILERSNGWDIVEYTPGLRGFIMETIVAPDSDLSAPVAGGFNPINSPSEVANISNADGVWTISVNGHNYKGVKNNNVLVFLNDKNQIAYSLVVIDGQKIVYSYDNSLTKFF